MSFAADRCRRIWARAMRAYHLACARDDASAHGVAVPSGVWTCQRCGRVLLELGALREHLRLEHAA
ncbi:hypothetical protein SAMN05421869_12227 [Nonomuraea jiangxiensis]|uniref:C2H2-type domain-containing protein n=2 Tax=Nonomuraea jiangxiensis TaxID=633440 RepID=A0A1G9H921_9ACTN|nr:hypothetical protein SAMN05421869_12227 [Nonomuraea jiangxiensis]